MNVITLIFSASKMVLRNRLYLIAFIVLICFFASIFYLIPVILIPGNDISFQVKLFGVSDYALIVLLAFVESLLLVLLWYTTKHSHSIQGKVAAFGHGAGSIFGGVLASLFGMKLCPMCLVFIFGILGIGYGTLPLFLEYRAWIFGSAVIIVVFLLYFTARKVTSTCGQCAKQCQSISTKNSQIS